MYGYIEPRPIEGTTGMAILRAVVAGERDPRQMAKLRDPHCRKERGRDRRVDERALAGRSSIQLVAGSADVRLDSGTDCRL